MKGHIEVEVNDEMLEPPFRIHQPSGEGSLMLSTRDGGIHMAEKDNIRMWIDGDLVFNNTK